MSNTLEEIAYFCEEENTFGALLLTGGWGCGKTYLLEHDLPVRLGEGFVLLRISLFGETSVDAIRQKLQKAYFDKLLELAGQKIALGETEFPEAGDSANTWIYKSEELNGVEKIFTQNPSDYIKLEPYILGRSVILIFDDLERCHLSQAETLGCINEYCENLHLKTIIVANEEKIKDNKTKNREDGKKDFLAYSEIKEKIIARTVQLKADYPVIVANIIDKYRTSQVGYVDFLRYSMQEILYLLEDSEIKNLRSLRCGFQDFERIYRLCLSEGLEDTEILKYFKSFVLFVLLAKGGQISKSVHFGYGLNRLQQKYPAHYVDRYMPNSMKDWVMSGAWIPKDILTAIRKNTELTMRTIEPKNLLRSMSLLEMDDETVQRGWADYLTMALEGELNLEEYVLLLRNLISAREYNFTWPVAVDEDALEIGVERAFRRICESDHAQITLKDRIDEATLRKSTKTEWRIYGKIVHFHDSKAYLYGLNRNRILMALKSLDEKELFKCRGYDTNLFDEEMVEAVVDCYQALDNNQRRMAFIDTLNVILRNCAANTSYQSRAVYEAIGALKNRILEVKDAETGLPLKAITTNYFLSKIEEVEKTANL